MRTGVGTTGGRALSAASLVGLVGLAAALHGSDAATAGFLLALAVPGRTRGMPGLVGSIAAGAVVLGVIGLAGGAVLGGGLDLRLSAGLGIAVGGGVGAVIWLLAVGDSTDGGPETVAVDAGADERTARTPRPADLFAASPDPLVFFAGDEPVVRAVNPAFEEVFGTAGGLEDADLAEAVMADATEEVLAAARAGEPFDAVLECQTAEGPRRMRLRLAVPEDGASGYLMYTPVGAD